MVLTALLGALCYWYDPFTGQLQEISGRHLLANVLFNVLLPFVTLPDRYGQFFPLNGPCWSLLLEYLANIAFILVASRLSLRTLRALVVLAGVVLVAVALHHGSLHGGWSWDNFWMGPVRVAFPFLLGLLLFRRGFVL